MARHPRSDSLGDALTLLLSQVVSVLSRLIALTARGAPCLNLDYCWPLGLNKTIYPNLDDWECRDVGTLYLAAFAMCVMLITGGLTVVTGEG